MATQITIRARVNEKITDGTGVPESVTVTGAGFLVPDCIRAIAQEAVDSYYGSYNHNRRATYNEFDHRESLAADADGETITVRVQEYRI
jgi:hypothetical protein